MRSHAQAPSAGSVWIAAMATTAIALALLGLGASSASAAINYVGTEAASEVQRDSASLNGYFENDGKEAHYFFEWGETEAYGHTTPVPPGAGISGGFQFVSPIAISGLLGGTTYHYRLVVSDVDGTSFSGDASFTTLPAVANLTTKPPTAITDTSAELNASFEGDGTSEVHYYFEWGTSTAYGNTTPVPPGNAVPAASGQIEVPPVAISGLEEGVTYHYRIKATNSFGTTVSVDANFKSAEAPIVSNVRSAEVKESSAELLGEINPRWGQTSYFFEWGTTAAYGNTTPIPAADLSVGDASLPVSVGLEGLSPGITYHFRLVASNPYGTTASPDQTVGFYPPACPNSQLRQETRSNDLPDCRAYELVTPSFAQGSTILPESGPTSSVATNPPRIAYGVTWGLFPESSGEGMNSLNDAYVSTRTDTGWTQRYVGLRGGEVPPSQGILMGGPLVGGMYGGILTGFGPAIGQRGTQASPSLDRLINYNWGYPGQIQWAGTVGSNSPYVWDTSSGELLERWPRNFAQVPGGAHFVGMPQASADFSHFVFSSNVVFAAGGEASEGEIHCCGGTFPFELIWPKASVYDYDTQTGTDVLASRRKDGTPFQGRAFDISEDGSHILMSEEALLGPNGQFPAVAKEFLFGAKITGPLYLRVNDEKTYEIAPGHTVEYAGSTADGSTVYLASDEQLTPDDHDSSRDLFVWHQSDPNTLTRVSVGNHGTAGNTDECTPNEGWSTGCGISVIHMLSGFGVNSGNGHSDNFLAFKSGDIYFESPEQLVGSRGEAGERNLYLYREGTVRYVTTMKPNMRISRMQVTPDGRHMALTTGSNLTEYDSAGHVEMYLYDPEGGRVTCASCRPDGQPPVSNVTASQNGLFLTNDGRAFFATNDPLVPRDTNEQIDVYEFTEGKAQLITTGLGPGIAETAGIQQLPGLVNVSANGTDAYFATTDSLVTQDHNGAQLKIYDARTGGGFPAEREEPKCVAADECHGPGNNPPVLPPDRTSATFGVPHKAKAHKHKKHRKAHNAHKHKKKRAGKAKRKQASAKQGGKHHG